ncbi:MAG: hypothetical protein ACK56I_20815, partial [bacterium]
LHPVLWAFVPLAVCLVDRASHKKTSRPDVNKLHLATAGQIDDLARWNLLRRGDTKRREDADYCDIDTFHLARSPGLIAILGEPFVGCRG